VKGEQENGVGNQ